MIRAVVSWGWDDRTWHRVFDGIFHREAAGALSVIPFNINIGKLFAFPVHRDLVVFPED